MVIDAHPGSLGTPTSSDNPPSEDLERLLETNRESARLGKPLLTRTGERFVRELLTNGSKPIPHWLRGRRELWFNGRRLKRFRQPAEFQVALLEAFEAAGWPSEGIVDPLPHGAGDSQGAAARRLLSTIKNLNRSLPRGSIVFRFEFRATRVRWERTAALGSMNSSRKSTLHGLPQMKEGA